MTDRDPKQWKPLTWWRKRHPATRFVIGFLLGLAVTSVCYTWLSVEFNAQMITFMGWTASMVGGVLELFGVNAIVMGRLVHVSNFSVEIVEECTGAYEIVILLSALAAYPTKTRQKIYGALFAIPTLLAINVIRMVMLVLIGNYSIGDFEFWHEYFWQVTLIIMIVTVWILWIKLFGIRHA